MEIINMGGQISVADFGQFSLGVYNYQDLESQISGLNLKKFVEGNPNFNYDWLSEIIVTMLPLYLLGFIVYAHESFTRYSDELMKPQDYNESLGIVQVFPRIWNLGNNILMKLNS